MSTESTPRRTMSGSPHYRTQAAKRSGRVRCDTSARVKAVIGEIAAEAIHCLAWDVAGPPGAVRVKVEQGW